MALRPDNPNRRTMAAQADPEKLWRLNWQKPWPEWLRRSPPRSSANGSAGSPEQRTAETAQGSAADTPTSSPARSPAASTPNSTANGSDGFPPLTVVRTGQSVWIKKAPGYNIHWTNRDFALEFLYWLVTEYPECRDGWVNVPDLEQDFFERFRDAAGCTHVEDGALFRGLTEVLGRKGKRDQPYRNALGERYWMVEYKVPASAAAVVELAAVGRKRA